MSSVIRKYQPQRSQTITENVYVLLAGPWHPESEC